MTVRGLIDRLRVFSPGLEVKVNVLRVGSHYLNIDEVTYVLSAEGGVPTIILKTKADEEFEEVEDNEDDC